MVGNYIYMFDEYLQTNFDMIKISLYLFTNVNVYVFFLIVKRKQNLFGIYDKVYVS